MSGHDETLSLIRHVYTAAADESQWPSVLERLSDEYGGGVAGFQHRTGIEGRVRSARFVRIDPALERAATTLGGQNPWTRLSQPLFRAHGPGFIYTSQGVLPPSDLQRTDYYDGVLRPAGILHGFGACVSKGGDEFLSFTVLRSPARGPFEASDLERVRPILPHLARAVQANERFASLDRTRAALADALESLRHGVVVVDRRGRVVFANRAARDIAGARDGLSITADGLVASVSVERSRLRALFDDAVRTAAGEGFGSGGTMTVTRASLKRPYLVVVAPLPLTLDGENPAGLATVFISDPEAHVETGEEFMQRLYGLSARESRVATAFAATCSLDEVADKLCISRETVRWHLRHIYAKTGAHRQATLLRLIEGPSQLRLETAPPGTRRDTGF
jgi:DNA-binding CsgD family transcriptional regulator